MKKTNRLSPPNTPGPAGKRPAANAVHQRAIQQAISLLNAGRFADAERLARQFVIANKKIPVGYNLLGVALHKLQRFDDAIKSYRSAVKLRPDFAEAHANMGTVLRDIGRPAEAAACHKRAIKSRPDYAPAYYNLANAQIDLGQDADALKNFDQAIATDPTYFQAHYNKGLHLQQIGRLDEAEAALKKTIEINPNFAEAYRNLGRYIHYAAESDDYNQLKTMLQRPNLPKADEMHLSLAMAKAQQDVGEFDAAFDGYVRGNALRRASFSYDQAQQGQYFNKLGGDFTPAHFTSDLAATPRGPTPIFVLGMPRSGTTLVEQILSSHSAVTGAGELKFLPDGEREHFGQHLADMIYFSNQTAKRQRMIVGQIAKTYYEKLRSLSISTPNFVDKTPSNFRFIPLIKLAFPDAKIIHVTRNPKANCWAVFKTYFSAGGHAYSYDLDEMVSYHNSYRQLMNRYHALLPGQIHDISYEALIADQEAVSRTLLSACGLPWEKACLDFHKTVRDVKTASATQVRQPIYKTSLEEWKKFEHRLAPFYDKLITEAG